MSNGYERMHPVAVQARADMLDSVAGLDAKGLEREITFAAGMLDSNDEASLRWMVCLAARRIAELDSWAPKAA